MANTTERRQLLAYDRIVKTRAWASLLIVHPKSDAEVNALLAWCPRLQLTVVWDPGFIPPRAPPTERTRRTAVLARLRVTAGANSRLTILAGGLPELAAEIAKRQHAGELHPFSGAVLAQVDEGKPIGPQLRAWGALCAPEGTLIGKAHADLRLRSELVRAAPKWRPWPNGLWLIDVRDLQGTENLLNGGEETSAIKTHPTVLLAPMDPVAVPTPFTEAGSVPPLSSEPEPEPGPEVGPISPLAGINLTRSRPVWETLEQNLGLV